jgi:hypothetical protein
MHSDWFNRIEILQSRWQHGEKVGYCYPSGLEKTLCKWEVYVPLVTKGLMLCQLLYIKLKSSGDETVVTQFEVLRQMCVLRKRKTNKTNQDLLFKENTALLMTDFSDVTSC